MVLRFIWAIRNKLVLKKPVGTAMNHSDFKPANTLGYNLISTLV